MVKLKNANEEMVMLGYHTVLHMMTLIYTNNGKLGPAWLAYYNYDCLVLLLICCSKSKGRQGSGCSVTLTLFSLMWVTNVIWS